MGGGQPLRVVFDLSVLGLGEQDPACKTGIHRTVSQLQRSLVADERIVMRWSSFGEYSHWFTERGLRRSGESLSYSVQSSHLYSAINVLASTIRRFDRLTKGRVPGLRFAGAALKRRISSLEKHLYSVPVSADIWHSPTLSFPEFVRGDYLRFFTVFDLIPLKFPQYFQGLPLSSAEILIRSLRPDDWVLCISESAKQDLLSFRADLKPEQVRVTPLAASDVFHVRDDPEQRAALRRQIGVPPNARYLLSVGTLEPRKNLPAVLRAFQALASTIPDLHLVLVGGMGWDSVSLRQQLAEDKTERVHVTGFLPDEALAHLYSDCAAFLYMSLYEGFGLPPLEAMQCGAPVICSNNSSLPEVVGEAGILLEAIDHEKLVVTIQRLLGDQTLTAELRRKSLRQAAKFSWQRTKDLTIQAYEDAFLASKTE